MTPLIFGNADSDFVQASFGQRPYENSEHAFDRNQVAVQLDLAVWPFQATFEATWLVESFQRFRLDLQRAYDSLTGEAEFGPDFSRSLEVVLQGDGVGHFTVRGTICVNPATGPWFRFELPTIDQTYLPPLIETLSELESEYPIL